MFAGKINTGGSTSRTMTENDADAVLPATSIAVQVTVDVPSAKKAPLCGRHKTFVPGPLSETTGGGYVTTAPG
jgi:hypothetical protein